MKKFLFLLAFLIFSIVKVSSIEMTFKLTPSANLPFLSDKNMYDFLGFGADFQGGLNFFDVLNVGPEFYFTMLPKENSGNLKDDVSKFVNFFAGGIHFGALLYPASRVEMEIGGAFGPYISFNKTVKQSSETDKEELVSVEHSAPWYKAFTNVAFRLTPNWTIGAEVSLFDYQSTSYWGKPGAAGITAGISVRYKFDTQKSNQNVEGSIQQDDSIFPLMYSLYKEGPFATIKLYNDETAEIRNVKVYFRAGKYTASEIECGSVAVIKKHKTVDIDLIADFSRDILNFTEEGKIPGELVVNYELLGQPRTSISQIIIPVYNRNQIRWIDPQILAVFISPKAPEILEYSKQIVGLARKYQRSGLNRNLQYEMYVFEGLRISGIVCREDENTPYDSTHLDDEALDYIQYPYQTMTYKAGDKDDLGILFMNLLQSTNIEAAFIPTPNDFIVALNLNLEPSKVNSFFDGKDRILEVNDSIWVPVAMSSIREGFINSWYKAIEELNKMKNNGEEIGFYPISESSESYPSVGFSGGEVENIIPNEKLVIAAAETNISRYITAEFGPQIAAVQEKIKQQGISVKLLNQLGMLYLRAGMYSSAIPIYERSAQMGSTTAMINLGNIASIQKKFAEAKKWFEKVLEISPKNKTARTNLDSILREFDE